MLLGNGKKSQVLAIWCDFTASFLFSRPPFTDKSGNDLWLPPLTFEKIAVPRFFCWRLRLQAVFMPMPGENRNDEPRQAEA
jgi:hypothetical protein